MFRRAMTVRFVLLMLLLGTAAMYHRRSSPGAPAEPDPRLRSAPRCG